MTPSEKNPWLTSTWAKLGLLAIIVLAVAFLFRSPEKPKFTVLTDEEVQALPDEEYFKYRDRLAIVEYTEAVEADPNNAALRSERAAACLKRGRYNMAFEDAQLAIELDPQTAKNYLILGEALYGLDKYQESIVACSQYIERVPDDPKGYFERGYSYHRSSYFRGDDVKDRAVADFKKAIDLNPTTPADRSVKNIETRQLVSDKSSAYFGLGLAYNRKHDYASALLAFEQSNEYGPKNPNTLRYIERLRKKLGYDTAEEGASS
ncbi:MAG: hypothetical protein AAFY48_14560 [Bacteroidota bacterium]